MKTQYERNVYEPKQMDSLSTLEALLHIRNVIIMLVEN